MRAVASVVAALIFSKASLACAEPFPAVARNACVASIPGELAGFVVVVLVVESNMSLISLRRFLLRTSGRDALDAGRMPLTITAGGAAFGAPMRSLADPHIVSKCCGAIWSGQVVTIRDRNIG